MKIVAFNNLLMPYMSLQFSYMFANWRDFRLIAIQVTCISYNYLLTYKFYHMYSPKRVKYTEVCKQIMPIYTGAYDMLVTVI